VKQDHYVSPRLVASASHVCEPKFVRGSIPFSLKAVYFTLESEVFDIDPRDMSSESDCTRAVPLLPPATLRKLDYLDGNPLEPWVHGNDFCFLRIESRSFDSGTEFAYPTLPPLTLLSNPL